MNIRLSWTSCRLATSWKWTLDLLRLLEL